MTMYIESVENGKPIYIGFFPWTVPIGSIGIDNNKLNGISHDAPLDLIIEIVNDVTSINRYLAALLDKYLILLGEGYFGVDIENIITYSQNIIVPVSNKLDPTDMTDRINLVIDKIGNIKTVEEIWSKLIILYKIRIHDNNDISINSIRSSGPFYELERTYRAYATFKRAGIHLTNAFLSHIQVYDVKHINKNLDKVISDQNENPITYPFIEDLWCYKSGNEKNSEDNSNCDLDLTSMYILNKITNLDTEKTLLTVSFIYHKVKGYVHYYFVLTSKKDIGYFKDVIERYATTGGYLRIIENNDVELKTIPNGNSRNGEDSYIVYM